MLTTKRPHPPNRLYRGEVTDFEDAMQIYIAQMEYENAVTEQLAREYPPHPQYGAFPSDEERKQMKLLTLEANKAREALAVYQRHHAVVLTNIAAELRAKNDETFTSFADALESGDYSGLAI